MIKKDGNVRVCGDFKVTVNPDLKIDVYPFSRIEDIYGSFNGGKIFSVIDLKQVYLQMEEDDESKPYVTINTHRGLYQYQGLPYGIASAPVFVAKCNGPGPAIAQRGAVLHRRHHPNRQNQERALRDHGSSLH